MISDSFILWTHSIEMQLRVSHAYCVNRVSGSDRCCLSEVKILVKKKTRDKNMYQALCSAFGLCKQRCGEYMGKLVITTLFLTNSQTLYSKTRLPRKTSGTGTRIRARKLRYPLSLSDLTPRLTITMPKVSNLKPLVYRIFFGIHLYPNSRSRFLSADRH